MSFLAAAGKKTTDIRTFLKEVGGGSTIKYKPEKGVKHYVYILRMFLFRTRKATR